MDFRIELMIEKEKISIEYWISVKIILLANKFIEIYSCYAPRQVIESSLHSLTD